MELEQLRTRLASAMEARGYSQKSIDGLASVLNRIRRFSENCHGMDTEAILSRWKIVLMIGTIRISAC